MYTITYTMFSGDTTHRARSATVALQVLNLIRESGGKVERIAVTRTGSQISLRDLRRLADDEITE